MKKLKTLFLFILIAGCFMSFSQQPVKLSGTYIGTTKNSLANAFDGNTNTSYYDNERSRGWVGMDLGKKHVIKRIVYRGDANYLFLGVFEGANEPTFEDALPLHMITVKNAEGDVVVNNTKGFRYLRYVSPTINNSGRNCRISEIEFWGYEGEGDDGNCLDVIWGIPTVVIHTAMLENGYTEDMPHKEKYLTGKVSFISTDGSIRTEVTEIRGRGNASWGFDKKPYRLKLNKDVLKKPEGPLGNKHVARNWTLISNHGDKTLMRNFLAFDLSRRLEMNYTSSGRPVNVFLDGEYKGCYQFSDHIEVQETKFELNGMDVSLKNLDADTDPNKGEKAPYMIEIDAYAYSNPPEPVRFTTNSYNLPVNVRYPKDDDIIPEEGKTWQRRTYLENYISGWLEKMVSRAKSKDFSSATGVRKYLDTESFLKHFLVGEFSGNTDTYWSTYMYKHVGDDKFYVGPVWDFDIAYANDNRTYRQLTEDRDGWVYRNGGSAAGGMAGFVTDLLNDKEIKQELKDIWAKYRNNLIITEAKLVKVIDDYAAEMDASQKLNFQRWEILSSHVHMNPVARGSYKAEVDFLRGFVKQRLAWMDRQLDYKEDYLSIPIFWVGLQDSDWYNKENWYPKNEDLVDKILLSGEGNVHIAGNAKHFPVLNKITSVNTITFHYGAELVKPHYLKYNKVYVHYNFGVNQNDNVFQSMDEYSTLVLERDKWHAISVPLKKAVAADFSLGGQPLTLHESFSPSVHEDGYKVAKWEYPLSDKAWTVESRHNAMLLQVASYQADEFGYKSHHNLNKLNGIFELPYFQNIDREPYHTMHNYNNGISKFYDYYLREGYPRIPVSVSKPAEIERGAEAYRFVFDNNVKNFIYTIEVPAGEDVLIGNPFISSLDMNGFIQMNKDVIEGNAFLKFKNNSFKAASLATGVSPVEPLEAFIVKTKANQSGKVNLMFDLRNHSIATQKNQDLDYKDNVLYLTASSEKGESNAIISYQDIENDNVMAYRAHDNQDVPVVYISDDKNNKNAIQFAGGYVQEIALGVLSDAEDMVEFKFDNLEGLNVEGIYLVDKMANNMIDLFKQDSYRFKNNPSISDRFSIVIKDSLTNLTPDESKINVYNSGSNIVISTSLYDPIQSVALYNLQGQLLISENGFDVSLLSLNVSGIKGVVIVKVNTELSIQTVKLILD